MPMEAVHDCTDQSFKVHPGELAGLNIALVQPAFPFPSKSKNSHHAVPYGLLKIASWLESIGATCSLFTEGSMPTDFEPDEVWITSLFTYWSEYVVETFKAYQGRFPRARIRIGGILPTLAPSFCKATFGPRAVHEGLLRAAEAFPADYSLLPKPLDFQVLVASRGCIRRCQFCYAWRIEGHIQGIPVETVIARIHKNRVVFYDNNFLANPFVDELLERLNQVQVAGRRVQFECQSGFDGRILQERPELAAALRQANFKYPRIAWDGPLSDASDIRRQIDILIEAGFRSNDIQLFMLFNHDLSPEVLDAKRRVCWDWQIQVIDCRFRPLDQFFDYFSSRKDQTSADYHIHTGWTDESIKAFRRAIRRQNICVRYRFPWHSKYWERKSHRERLPDGILSALKSADPETIRQSPYFKDAFFPEVPLSYPSVTESEMIHLQEEVLMEHS